MAHPANVPHESGLECFIHIELLVLDEFLNAMVWFLFPVGMDHERLTKRDDLTSKLARSTSAFIT